MRIERMGPALIVAGTAVGAGMLALPMTAFYLGFPLALALLALLALYMYYNGLVGLEVTLQMPEASSVPHMMGRVFGPAARLVTTLVLGLFFYGLLVAYVAGSASILQALQQTAGFHLDFPWEAAAFTVILATPVVRHMKALDRAMKVLFAFKTVIYVAVLVGVLAHVKLAYLTQGPVDLGKGLLMSLPIFFASFGFHGTIPSLTTYAKRQTTVLSQIFRLGVLCALSFYVLWFVATLGVMPQEMVQDLLAHKVDVGPFIAALAAHTGYAPLVPLSLVFSLFSISTSFVGVSVGLYHMCFEGLAADNKAPSQTRKIGAVLITYGGPLLIALLNPHVFLRGLEYAAAAAIVIFVLCPALLAKHYRSRLQEGYRAPGGSMLLLLSAVFGVLIMACSLLG